MWKIALKRLERYLTFRWKRLGNLLSFLLWTIFWVSIFYFLIGIFALIFQKIFGKNLRPSDSDFILLITAAIILFYTYETNQTKKEIIIQNEVEQRPVLVLQVTTKRDLEQKGYFRDGNYLITHQIDNAIKASTYTLTIRNIGKGPAMNIRVSNKNFEVEKYEERFIIQMEGEYAIKIAKKLKDGKDGLAKVRDLAELNNEIFSICCDSLSAQEYYFVYKIINLEEKRVEFIEMGRI